MWKTQVRSFGQEDPLEEEMATHFSILAWKIPWAKEPGRLQSLGLQGVEYDRAAEHTRVALHRNLAGQGTFGSNLEL